MARSYNSAFKCPTCDHDNRNPVVGDTEGGTPIATCDECGAQVSRALIAEVQDKMEAARREAINNWAGWGVDVV